MKTHLLTKALNDLIGKSVTYQGKKVEIMDWNIDAEEFSIETNDGPITAYRDNAEKLFTELKVDVASLALNAAVVTTKQDLQEVLPSSTVMAEVNSMLLDAMRNVKKDKEWVAQANAMSNAAQTIVNSNKLLIDAAKLMISANRK